MAITVFMIYDKIRNYKNESLNIRMTNLDEVLTFVCPFQNTC